MENDEDKLLLGCSLALMRLMMCESETDADPASGTRPSRTCTLDKSLWRLTIVPDDERVRRWCRMTRTELFSLARQTDASVGTDEAIDASMDKSSTFSAVDAVGALLVHLAHGEYWTRSLASRFERRSALTTAAAIMTYPPRCDCKSLSQVSRLP